MMPAIIAYRTNRFELLFVSRALIGISVGFATVAQAAYITEISPQHLKGLLYSNTEYTCICLYSSTKYACICIQVLQNTRVSPPILGRMNSMIGLMIRIGFLLGTVVASNGVLGTEQLWVYCFVIEAVVSLLSTVAAVVSIYNLQNACAFLSRIW